MAGTHMLRAGSWRVELHTPLKLAGGKELNDLTISPPNFDHVVRWNNDQIVSNLALLAELCGVSESVLRTMTFPDAERVMLALVAVCPTVIQQAINGGAKPLATPRDSFIPSEGGNDAVDDHDPRFPRADGPVERFEEKPPGLGASPEETIAIGPAAEITRPVNT